MPKMIHSKYGYEPPEYVKADAELEKWLKKKKEGKACLKQRNGRRNTLESGCQKTVKTLENL
ncbi:hypothetical protein EFT87_13540 [Schleiferilactobacillus harbinensis]|nr:hypothetical protein [Schleiferilactobacillus harbinensis]